MRVRSVGVVVGLACLVFLVPSAVAAGKVVMDFESPAKANIQADATQTGSDAATTRSQIDGMGNHDGTVTQSEVDAAEETFKEFFSNFGEEGATGSAMQMDGNASVAFKFEDLDIHDATGLADSQDPITYHLAMAIEFNPAAGDRHTLTLDPSEDGDGDSGFGEYDSAVIKAPPGYIIESTEGLPSHAKVSGDKKSITFDGTLANPEPMAITFSKGGGGGGGTPGWGFVAGFAALIVASGIRRRVARPPA